MPEPQKLGSLAEFIRRISPAPIARRRDGRFKPKPKEAPSP
jgi:hypothetical protein